MVKALVSNQRYAVFFGVGVAATASLGAGLFYNGWLLVIAAICGALFRKRENPCTFSLPRC
jgi:hypothetical protein